MRAFDRRHARIRRIRRARRPHRARMASTVEVARVGPKKQTPSLWLMLVSAATTTTTTRARGRHTPTPSRPSRPSDDRAVAVSVFASVARACVDVERTTTTR